MESDRVSPPPWLSAARPGPLSRELTLSGPRVTLGALLAATCGLWVVAYATHLLLQSTAVLTVFILVFMVSLMFYLHMVKVEHECVLLIAATGVQLTRHYASGRQQATFIEMARVKDIVINEVIHAKFKPRLDCLVEVYRTCQEVLQMSASDSAVFSGGGVGGAAGIRD
ncbi:phosphatidylinositol N-acetylglucosaminyltransferase subunit H isoform X3 [Lethenteron reissneri]|uniref:phosphatidylinositol N-acetylglucosaminyltransferase subunit H isoform X3 n=1 Tax=Lethenteron reissneri TaxID=7753 RepID=UPI002AB6BF15|nr:phosphatidylinositol N-acetylglucosaminyltransferase subunit H isoform X3 [Lethenteron reissneri]